MKKGSLGKRESFHRERQTASWGCVVRCNWGGFSYSRAPMKEAIEVDFERRNDIAIVHGPDAEVV